jgi:hypothetical protein
MNKNGLDKTRAKFSGSMQQYVISLPFFNKTKPEIIENLLLNIRK